MIINSSTIIYFSPTGTTKKVAYAIVKGMGTTNNTPIDLTSLDVRNVLSPAINGDIVIIGVPVYEERAPEMVHNFLDSLNGNNKPVVLVAVYGNFGEGIALNELEVMAKKSRFKIVAAGLFIGEHSFSTKEVPVQEGRPNYEDLNKAEVFGKRIIDKMKKTYNLNESLIEIPKGKLPLMARILPKNSARMFTKAPLANMDICNKCGLCIKLCPMNAINKDTMDIDQNKCIRCFCCVKKCPKKARKIVYKPKIIVSKILNIKNKKRREPQIYI